MRLRARFTKLGKVRWTSHRDLARMWERALRRAAVPVSYTGGFSPRPRISFGLALPTGAESVAEYLDVDVDGDVDPAPLTARLSAALPAGVDVTALAHLGGGPSLQQEVTSCTWEIGGIGQIDVAAVLGAPELIVARERKGRRADEDIRPGIFALHNTDGRLVAELAAQPRAVRPAELLDALGVDAAAADVRRTHQWTERAGERWEPLTPDAPHAEERAS